MPIYYANAVPKNSKTLKMAVLSAFRVLFFSSALITVKFDSKMRHNRDKNDSFIIHNIHRVLL